MNLGKTQMLILLNFLLFIRIKCTDVNKHVLFISDYVKWRKISNLIYLDNNMYSDKKIKMLKDSLNLFANQNINFAAHSSLKWTEAALNRTKQQTAVVTFLNSTFNGKDLLDEAKKITQYGEKTSWLIVANCHLPMEVFGLLRYVNFGINEDIVLAFDNNCINSTTDQNITKFENPMNNLDAFLPFRYNANSTMSNSTYTCTQASQNSSQEMFFLYQVYKIRKTFNTSLVVRPLGVWDLANSNKNLKPFWYIDNRKDFQQFPLIFGFHDAASDGPLKIEDNNDQLHFVKYFAYFLNASTSFQGFLKLGHRENGEWTDLLNAIFVETVDISGQGISKTNDRINDMAYSFDILKNTRNIYIEPEESETMRDIYLTPFDTRLILCVLGSGIVLSIAMTVNNFTKTKLWPNGVGKQKRDFSESIVWCVGIFSQQGSIWKTRSVTEKIIVIIALFLTILIYNSYSAFITSVLSVQLNSIRNINDLLQSDYKIGYTKESQDEDYLRSVNISELKQIYLRGYLQNDITNITEGLVKVSNEQFALFASGQMARPVLWNLTKSKCTSDIDEIKIPYTAEYMAFIMAKESPFKRLFNQGIIKMLENGIYRYIYSIIYPDLMNCEKPKTFQSAGLADLSTAFIIVIFGWAASFGIMLAECFWKKRHKIYESLKKRLASTAEDNFNNGGYYIQGPPRMNIQYNMTYPNSVNKPNNMILAPIEKRVAYFDFVN